MIRQPPDVEPVDYDADMRRSPLPPDDWDTPRGGQPVGDCLVTLLGALVVAAFITGLAVYVSL